MVATIIQGLIASGCWILHRLYLRLWSSASPSASQWKGFLIRHVGTTDTWGILHPPEQPRLSILLMSIQMALSAATVVTWVQLSYTRPEDDDSGWFTARYLFAAYFMFHYSVMGIQYG